LHGKARTPPTAGHFRVTVIIPTRVCAARHVAQAARALIDSGLESLGSFLLPIEADAVTQFVAAAAPSE